MRKVIGLSGTRNLPTGATESSSLGSDDDVVEPHLLLPDVRIGVIDASPKREVAFKDEEAARSAPASLPASAAGDAEEAADAVGPAPPCDVVGCCDAGCSEPRFVPGGTTVA